MGVINVTPNSFSDGGECLTLQSFSDKIKKFGRIDAIDIGAESTAPMNASINTDEEWMRLSPFLPLFKTLGLTVSIDTYHPETIEKVAAYWINEKITTPLIWNDVSGKFDESVRSFLKGHDTFYYVSCHNLAPTREMTGEHINFCSALEGENFLDEVASFLRPAINDRVIFDPALGFSKTYEQNWNIIHNFGKLQKKTGHEQWLLGLSRKSFLRKKLGIEKITTETREKLDSFHGDILSELIPNAEGKLWIRTHRPELIT